MNAEVWRDGRGALEAKIRSWTLSSLERTGIMPILSGTEGGNAPISCWLQPGWGVPGEKQ